MADRFRDHFRTTIANEAYSRNSLSFKTFSADDDTVSFVMFNDIHGRAQFMKDISKYIDFSSVDFVAFNGDMSRLFIARNKFSLISGCCRGAFCKEDPDCSCQGNHETRDIC